MRSSTASSSTGTATTWTPQAAGRPLGGPPRVALDPGTGRDALRAGSPVPGGLPAGAAQHRDRVTVDDGTGNTASTSFTLTRRALALLTDVRKTSKGETGRFKVWGFSLDGSARQVYLHYVGPSGHLHRTVTLGTTGGACGQLVSKRELFVPFSLSRGTWTLQVDTRRTYTRRPDGPSSRIRVKVA